MTRKELLELIDSSVNDIFLKYQKFNNIESGDITPLQSLRLDNLQENLADIIIEVGNNKKNRRNYESII